MTDNQSPRIAGMTVEVDPERDFVVPMGLYQNEESLDPLSLLLFPVRTGDGWEMPPQWNDMFLRGVFYVISPSVTPLPPHVRLVYTTERNYQPAATTSFKSLRDSFDVKKLREVSADMQHTDKLGLVFGVYTSHIKHTIPLYFYTRRVTDGTVTYASLNSTPPKGVGVDPLTDTLTQSLDWNPRTGGRTAEMPTVSPVYVLSEKPTGFSFKNGVCLPSLTATENILTCLQRIPGNSNDLERRGINTVDEELGVGGAPIYSVKEVGTELAGRIGKVMRAHEDARLESECPVGPDYRKSLRTATVAKRSFIAGLSMSLLICIVIVTAVAAFVFNAR